MKYEMQQTDAPFLLRQMIQLATEQLSSRSRKSKFNRLASVFKSALGVKTEIQSLSITLDSANVLLSAETTEREATVVEISLREQLKAVIEEKENLKLRVVEAEQRAGRIDDYEAAWFAVWERMKIGNPDFCRGESTGIACAAKELDRLYESTMLLTRNASLLLLDKPCLTTNDQCALCKLPAGHEGDHDFT